MTLTDSASRTRELIEHIVGLDDAISVENQKAFIRRARQIAPGVAGIILAEPDGLESALESIDPEFSSGPEISWRLNERQPSATGLLLRDDATVVADGALVQTILDLLLDPDDFPTDRVGEILPGVSLRETLDRLGWRPFATLSAEELAHDQIAIDDERSDQRYGPIRESVISDLPAILSLKEIESDEPHFDPLAELLEKRATLAAELKMESDLGFVRTVLRRFPAAASIVSGMVFGEEVVVSVLDAQGDTLYSIKEDEEDDPSWPSLADGSRPSGEPVTLDPDLFHPWTGQTISDGVRVSVPRILAAEHHAVGIVDEFVERGLLSSSWLLVEPKWKRRANRHLAGEPGQWVETDVNNFMSLAAGALERALLVVLCSAAGVGYQPTYRLMSGRMFADRVPSGRKGNRAIDLVIADTQDDQTTWEPIVAIEIKFQAKVNGHETYCTNNPDHTNIYSNQIICYPKGCVHRALRADRVRFLWISPGEHNSVANAYFAIDERDLTKNPELFGAAFKEQEEASKLWHVASWAHVIKSVTEELAPYGPRIVTAVERAFTTEPEPRDMS
jgi:hypothetical protein